MMRSYDIYQVDAFTKTAFTGNPAGVVLDATGLSDHQMQMIAREMNNSETAFVLPSINRSEYDVEIKFFTPTTEVPICGHATISAHYVRAVVNNLEPCMVVQKTKVGILPVQIIKTDGDYEIIMTQGKIEFGKVIEGGTKARLVASLGLAEDELNERCPIQIVSTGHSKVIIGIKSRSVLNNLFPDLGALKTLSKAIGCNGYFVFTLDSSQPDILTHGRMFAPAIGIAEDPVTGNANGPLGAYIVRHELCKISGNKFSFTAQQGEAMGRTGRVKVMVDIDKGKPQKVRIGGNAVIVFKTNLLL